MRVHSLQAVGRKAQLNFTLHIFHQERPISERKVVGIEETLFLWHLALRDKRKKECSEGMSRLCSLNCMFVCEITLDWQTVIAKANDVPAFLFVRYLSCCIDQRQNLSIALHKISFFSFSVHF